MIIKKNIINEIEIKKSKFIVFLIKLENTEEVKKELSDIKKIHKSANHYCYAYIIGSKEKASDDGEPTGTAGIPILNILKYEKLENILCVVVRYFGGIKLGAGGLIRSYALVTKETISLVEKEPLIKYEKFEITINYNQIKEIDYLLKNCIVEKEFNNVIKYKIKIPLQEKDIIDKIKATLL